MKLLILVFFIFSGSFYAQATFLEVLSLKSKDYNRKRFFYKSLNVETKPKQIVYGHEDVGFFKLKAFSFRENKVHFRFIPPTYIRKIKFYAIYKAQKWKLIGESQYNSPYLDTQVMFNIKTKGQMSSPFFIASIFMYKHTFAENRFNALKSIFAKSDLDFDITGIKTFNVIFNNLGEIVYDFSFANYISDIRDNVILSVPRKIYLSLNYVEIKTFTGETLSSVLIPFVNRSCRFGKTLSEIKCIAKDEKYVKQSFFSASKFFEVSKIIGHNFTTNQTQESWHFFDSTPIQDIYGIKREDLTHENALELRGQNALLTQRFLNRAILIDLNTREQINEYKINETFGVHSARFIDSKHIAMINNGDKLSKIEIFNEKGNIVSTIFPPKPLHWFNLGDINPTTNNTFLAYFHNHNRFEQSMNNYIFEINWKNKMTQFEFSLNKHKYINYGHDFNIEKIFSRKNIYDEFLGYTFPK